VRCLLIKFQAQGSCRAFCPFGSTFQLGTYTDLLDSFWGIFWVDASSEDTAQEGFLNIARVCRQEENVGSIKAWLSRKDHWLLILDNVDDPDVDIAKFFPTRDRGTILITTRNPDLQKYRTAASCSYEVKELSLWDATALLLEIAAIEDPQAQHTRQLAERIVSDVGYLALAIIQAGAVIRQGICSLDGFRDLYSKRKREILEMGRSNSNADDYQYTVFTTWEISIAKIEEMPDEDAKLALELLRIFSFMHFDSIREEIFRNALENSLYAEDAVIFKGSLLAKLMNDGWNSLLWGKAMKILLAFSLVTTTNLGSICMHPLVHLWSRDRMPSDEKALAWKTAVATLATSVPLGLSDEQKRQILLPHLDPVLAYDNQLFATGPDYSERSATAWKFHSIYIENKRTDKVSNIAHLCNPRR
jgi:NB-ARC domain